MAQSKFGLGFRCGFLGLLHLEIITERLEREFDINLLTTTPGVVYKVHLNNGNIQDLQNPSNLPKEVTMYILKIMKIFYLDLLYGLIEVLE